MSELKNCKDEKPCGCPVKDLHVKCITVDDVELSCSNIETPNQLDKILEQLDRFICEKDLLSTDYNLKNVGGGSKIYKGKNNLNDSLLRTITSSDGSIKIEQKPDEIDLKANPTLKISNKGDGVELFEINDEQTEGTIKTLKSSDGSVIITEIEEGVVDFKVTGTINEYNFTKRLYVNNGYSGTEENGSKSKPFKTIEKAVQEYIGSGTKENPEMVKGVIIVEEGKHEYDFKGNLSCRNLSIIIEENARVKHNPDTLSGGSFISFIDLDTLDYRSTQNFIQMKKGSKVTLKKGGFKNSGTTTGGEYKNIYVIGETGSKLEFSPMSQPTNALFESNYGAGINTPPEQGPAIYVYKVNSEVIDSSLYKVGGNSLVKIKNCSIKLKGTNSSFNVVPMRQTGGRVEVINTEYEIENINNSKFIYGFYIASQSNSQPKLTVSKVHIENRGRINNLIYNGTLAMANNCELSFTHNSYRDRSGYLSKVILNGNPTVKWTNINFNLNTIKTESLTPQLFLNIDLTRGNTGSSLNWVKNQVIENLPNFPNRQAASNVLMPGAKYLKTHGLSSPAHGSTEIDIVI